jgi:hypothetical protein
LERKWKQNMYLEYIMDEFYLYVSIAAVIILIISLASFGVTMYKVKQLDVFPPFQNSCPDYWDISGNTCGFPNQQNGAVNTGDDSVLKRTDCGFGGTATSVNCIYAMGTPYMEVDGLRDASTSWAYDASFSGTAPIDRLRIQRNNNKSFVELNGKDADTAFQKLYPGRSVRCAKKRWAELNGVTWDGITNYNAC